VARERHEGRDGWARVLASRRAAAAEQLEAISAARTVFSRCEFDEKGCDLGLKRLRAFRKEWDEDRGVWKDRPRHDDASHGADAFLTFACCGYTPPSQRRFLRPIDYGCTAWIV
jgi:hypothetical protein